MTSEVKLPLSASLPSPLQQSSSTAQHQYGDDSISQRSMTTHHHTTTINTNNNDIPEKSKSSLNELPKSKEEMLQLWPIEECRCKRNEYLVLWALLFIIGSWMVYAPIQHSNGMFERKKKNGRKKQTNR
jgi:hypothetical protein